MNELVDGLLACGDAEERKAFLARKAEPFPPRQIVGTLKERADALLRTDSALASRLAGIAQEVASRSDDPLCRATAAWCAGNAVFYLGHYQECLDYYRQAIPAFQDAGMTLEAARLYNNCVAVLTDLGRYEEALAEAEVARQGLKPHGPTHFLALLEMNIAVLHRHLDDYGAALAACDRGRDIAVALGSSVEAARFSVNRALILENLDSFRAAVATLKEVLPLFNEHGEVMEAARTQLNLGLLFTRMGRYRQALHRLERGRQGFAALDNEMEVAVVDWHRASVYLKLNLLPEVIELCAETRSIFVERGLVRQAVMADSEAAQAFHRIGEPDEALGMIERARQGLNAATAPVQRALLDLVQAGFFLDEGKPAMALSLAEGALAALRPGPFPVKRAQARLVMADCGRALGHPETATVAYREVLEVVEPTGLSDLTYRAQYGLGRIAESQGDDVAALAWYGQAVDTVAQASIGLGGGEFRSHFLADKLAAHQSAVILSLSSDDIAAAFDYAEMARTSAGLLMSLGTYGDRSGLDTSDPLRTELIQRRDEWNWHFSHLDRLRWTTKPATGDSDEESRPETGRTRAGKGEAEVLQQLRATERRLADLVHRTRLWQGVGHRDTVSLADVQARLQPEETLLAFFVAREQIVAFLVDQEHAVPVSDLATLEAVDQRLRRLRFSLPQGTDESLDHLARLYKTLLSPFESCLFDGRPLRRLTVVPHDLLFHLPFHALHDGQQYLLEQCEVVYLPAASLLGRRKAQDRSQLPSPRALIVGHDHDGRLPAALREAQTIYDTLSATAGKTGLEPHLLLDEEATDAELRRNAPDCVILHLATHGVFRHDNPLFSALRLADNWLTLADVERMDLPHASLVTLSACETGLGDLRGGDILGLSRAFLQAGAASLVVSLWPVPDEATRQLMIHFYHHLVAGMTKAAALRAAQLALLSDPVYSHPLHWAGFVLIGDGGTV